MLYEQCCLSHDLRTSWSGSGRCKEVPLRPDYLRHVRTIRLEVHHRALSQKTPKELVELFTHLTHANCSLKRLNLTFDFEKKPGYSYIAFHEHQVAIQPLTIQPVIDSSCFKTFARDTIIAAALASLPISQEVHIELSDNSRDAGELFTPFVQSIAAAKGWAFRQLYHSSSSPDCDVWAWKIESSKPSQQQSTLSTIRQL